MLSSLLITLREGPEAALIDYNDNPSLIEVATYFVYLALTFSLYFRPDKAMATTESKVSTKH